MAITVEDGSGLSNAETYATVAALKAYCDGRGYSYGSSSDTVLEQKLRIAADYINAKWRFKGTRKVSSQAMEFPRTGCMDTSGYEVTGVPARVANACCELAYNAISESLFQNLDRGGKIASESVGPISVSYAADAPAEKLYAAAESFLKPYIMAGGREFMAATVSSSVRDSFSNESSTYFSLGAMDSPGVNDGEV